MINKPASTDFRDPQPVLRIDLDQRDPSASTLTEVNVSIRRTAYVVFDLPEVASMAGKPSCATYLGPDRPHWGATLTDGSRVLIRPMDLQDAAAEKMFFASLSPESRRNRRFVGRTANTGDGLIDQLTDIDHVDDATLVAIASQGDGNAIIGVSRYAVDPWRTSCECAVIVADAWQGKGLGTALMQRLMTLAAERGLVSMRYVDLAENREIRSLASALGFYSRSDPGDPRHVIHTISLAAPRASTPVEVRPDISIR